MHVGVNETTTDPTNCIYNPCSLISTVEMNNLIDFDGDVITHPQPNHAGSHHPATISRNNDSMDVDKELFDDEDWAPDEASINYLKNLTRKYKGNPHSRRVPATYSWIQAKSGELQVHERDRLLAGAPIEDVFPEYDASDDEDACLLTEKIGKGTALALQACLREHIRFLCNKPSSIAAFPGGVVSDARRQQFEAHSLSLSQPDIGCTAEECCPDLTQPSRSPWNVTFVDAVTTDFIAKVAEDWYSEHGLPAEALEENYVAGRVLVCLRSMIKSRQIQAKLDTVEKQASAAAYAKFMQRRRNKHKRRLQICDEIPKYRKYYGLLKAVGPDGNSDEETDFESGVTPRPLRVFPPKWRSPRDRKSVV